jgi:hypothetical protein
MPSKTAATTLDTITTLEQHPLCQALHREKLALLERQRDAQAQLDSANAILRTPEADNPLQWRRARKQSATAEEALADIMAELMDVGEKLEAAKSAARADLYPMVEAEAVPVLEGVERGMLALIAAQEALAELDKRHRRLGLSRSLTQFLDGALPARLQALQHRLSKLQRR